MNWLVVFSAVVALVLNVWNVKAEVDLRELKQQIQARQGTIAQGLRYTQINTQLINALANIAAQTNDADIRDLLAGEGVTFTVNKNQAAEATGEEH